MRVPFRAVAATVLAAGALALTGCQEQERGSDPDPVAPWAYTAREANHPTATCLRATPALVAVYTTSLKRGIKLRAVRVVRSRDVQSVYFISGDLQGPGLGGKTEIATWAVNQHPDYVTASYSVDALARKFTTIRPPPRRFPDDALKLSRACVSRVLRR
jgi:hypothetical protein